MTKNSKLYMKRQKTENNQHITDEGGQSEGTHITQFQY